MESEINIVSLVKQQDEEEIVDKIKKIISEFNSSGTMEMPKVGHPQQIPNHSLITFNLPTEKALKIIVQLTMEGVPIVSDESFIKNAVKEGRFQLEQQKAEAIHEMGKKKTVRKEKEYTLEELAEMGNWKILVSLAKNQSLHNIEKSRKVIEMLPDILKRIIEHESLRGIDKEKFAYLSLEKLLPIAASVSLKSLRLTEYMQEAGEAAIMICAKYPKENLTDLITLSNSDASIPYVNLKAFITFYSTVKEDQESFKHDIINAAKKINTRALTTKSQVVFNLTKEENALFEEGVDFFTKKRKQL